MKILAKITYILLILVLLAGCLPLGVFAEGEVDAPEVSEPVEPDEPDVHGTDDFEYSVSPELQATITDYNGSSNTVAIPEFIGGYPVIAIADGVFAKHEEIVCVIFAEGLQSIGDCAFYGCSSLEAIILPTTLTHVGESAFEGCSSAYHADLGSSLISLGDRAFYGCSALDSVSLSKVVSTVGKQAFADCAELREVFLESTYAAVASDAFEGSPLVTVYAYADAAVHTAGGDYRRVVAAGAEALVFENFTGGLTVIDVVGTPSAIIIPQRASIEIVAIDNYALSKLPTLEAVHIPDTVITIGKSVFKDDVALTFVRLPRWVQSSPGQEMFYGCTSLRRVYLPEGTETLGMQSFLGCTSLKTVTFPSKLARIKSAAFSGCAALSTLYFLGDEPECAMTGGSASLVVMGVAPQDMRIFVRSDKAWGSQWRPNGKAPYLAYAVTPRHYDCFYIETVIIPLSCAADGFSRIACPHCSTSFDRIYPKYEHNFVSVGMGNGVESFRCTGCTENYTVGRLEIVDITATVDHIYTGTEMIRGIIVKYRNITLTEGVDYTVALDYSPQKSRITITVTGMGEYAGSRRAAYSSLTGNKLNSYTLTVVGGTGSGEYFRDDIVEIFPNDPIPEGMEAVWSVDGTKLRQGDNQKATIEMPAHNVTVTLGYKQATVTEPPVTTSPEPEITTPVEQVTTPPPPVETDPPVTEPVETDPPFSGTDVAHDFMVRAVLFGAILVVSLAGFIVMCIFMFKKDIKKN